MTSRIQNFPNDEAHSPKLKLVFTAFALSLPFKVSRYSGKEKAMFENKSLALGSIDLDALRVTPKTATILDDAAISCLPVSQLPAGNERQLSPHENQPEPTPATAPGRWIDERYQL